MKQLPPDLSEYEELLSSDRELATVVKWLKNNRNLSKIGEAIREAIDLVLDGVHTGRYSVDQLDKTEKTYIGTKVEHLVLHTLELKKEPPLDTKIADIPVDIKFSLEQNWEIPPEAVDRLCILVSANDSKSVFNFGVIRAKAEWLNRPNRDKKRALSAAGKSKVVWLYHNAQLPENLLLHLDPTIRDAILSCPSGKQRIIELFRRVHGRLINLTTVDTLGRQRDSSRRVREAREVLLKEGIEVLSVMYQKKRIIELGFESQIRGVTEGWIAVRH